MRKIEVDDKLVKESTAKKGNRQINSDKNSRCNVNEVSKEEVLGVNIKEEIDPERDSQGDIKDIF